MGALVLLLAGCVAAGRDKGLQPALTSEEVLAERLEPRRIAVLVGVDQYDDPAFPHLLHAEDDAQALGEALRRAEGGGFDQVRVISGAETTREGVARAFRELRDTVRREDAVVVYFSGHGTRVLDDDGWHRFLLVRDSRSGNLQDTAFDLAALQDWFTSVPSARKALIVDSCFSGDGKSVIRPDTLGRESAPGAPLLGALVPAVGIGEMQMFATTSGRPSREDDKLGHGVYTYFVLEALGWGFQEADLDDDGVVTAWEAHDYARSRTLTFTEGVQVPEAALRVVGEADLVLAGDPNKRRAREQALVYLYSSQGPYANAKVVVDGRDRGALPGVVPVEPGRHHLALESGGAVLVDGFVNFDADTEYRADDLWRLVAGPDRVVGLRPVFVASPPLKAVIGGGAAGIEAFQARRLADSRAWVGEAVIGGAAAPGRILDGEALANARPVLWSAYSVGWQATTGHLRGRAGLGASLVLAPPDYVEVYDGSPDPADVPSEAGWWLIAAGPSLGLGYTTGRWTFGAEARVHVAGLDVDGDGAWEAVPWSTWGLGIERGY